MYTENRPDALQRFKAALENSQERQETPNIAHFMFMIALTYYLDEKYEQAIAELEAIEPILRELQDSERRQLHQKIDILREFLPARVPDSEEEFEEQRQLFESSAVKAVKCTALLVCVLYKLLPRTRSYHSGAE